jgi:hypothetical protein
MRWIVKLMFLFALPISTGLPAKVTTPNGGTLVRGLQVSDKAYFDAARALLSCTDQKPLPPICKGRWRGIEWLLSTRAWTAQLDLPNGVRWFVNCHYDAIYQEDTCSWTTGDEFIILRGDGYSTDISWGLRRFPNSEMVARFDALPPIATIKTTWSAEQSTKIYRSMLAGKLLRYRWYSWPDNYERGGTIDLRGFDDAAALMEALRDEFTTSRVLHKTEVQP